MALLGRGLPGISISFCLSNCASSIDVISPFHDGYGNFYPQSSNLPPTHSLLSSTVTPAHSLQSQVDRPFGHYPVDAGSETSISTTLHGLWPSTFVDSNIHDLSDRAARHTIQGYERALSTQECVSTSRRSSKESQARVLKPDQQTIFTCATCHHRFQRKGNLKDHMKTHRNLRAVVQCQEKGCDKAYGRQADLTRHVRTVREILLNVFAS